MTKPQADHFRSIFVSDIHLGTRGSKAALFLDFLKHNDADVIYLVGDILDGWRLKSSFYWPQSHNDIVQKLLRKARAGAKIIYLPGNHDEFVRDYVGITFGGIEVVEKLVHTTAAGKRFLVMHGDQFDVVVRHHRWLAHLGDWAYEAAMFVNIGFNRVRRMFGFPYWSFSAWAKLKVKNAVNFVGDFETTLVAAARRENVDGVICGHIHHAMIREIEGLTYVNTGDFVESCSYVVERDDGGLEVRHWLAIAQQSDASTPAIGSQAAA